MADHQLAEAHAALLRGRSGRVDEFQIVAPTSGQVLRAPTAALFRRGDAWAAYAIEAGHAQSRSLTVGEQSPDTVEMRGIPREGDLLVRRPGEALREGARVEAAPELGDPYDFIKQVDGAW